MKDLLAHLWPWAEPLKKAIEEKDYDSALYLIKGMKEKWKLSKEQVAFIDNLEKEISKLKD